jgi:hypothetical protein
MILGMFGTSVRLGWAKKGAICEANRFGMIEKIDGSDRSRKSK